MSKLISVKRIVYKIINIKRRKVVCVNGDAGVKRELFIVRKKNNIF